MVDWEASSAAEESASRQEATASLPATLFLTTWLSSWPATGLHGRVAMKDDRRLRSPDAFVMVFVWASGLRAGRCRAVAAAVGRALRAAATRHPARRHTRGGDRPLDHARHHVLGLQAGLAARSASTPPGRQITGRQNGLAISGDYLSRRVVPRHRRPDLPLRLRRVPVLDRVPRRVPHGDVPAGRADAQRGQVHDRRRALVPPERDARAGRRRARHVRRRDLLPDRADGRRGRADPGAGRHRLLARGDPDRRLHALLRDLRRHGRHDVGADHQGRAADGGHLRDVDLRARQGRLQPDRAVQPRGREQEPRSRRSRSAPGTYLPKPLDTVSLGPGARARHRRPAAHPDALLHRARTPRPRARRWCGRCSSSASSTC